MIKKSELDKLNSMFKPNMTKDDLYHLVDLCLPSIKSNRCKIVLINKAYENFLQDIQKQNCSISIYKKEVEFLMNIPDIKCRNVFYGLMLLKKMKYHTSGWIKFSVADLKDLLEDHNLSYDRLYECLKYGLEIRVSGSKQSTPTFLDIDYLIYGEHSEIYSDDIAYDFVFKDKINVLNMINESVKRRESDNVTY